MTGGLCVAVLYHSSVDVVDSSVVVTYDRWSLCRGGL